MLIIRSMENADNINNSVFINFFIPPTPLNDNINGNILTYNESEDAYYIQHGADAVPKKLGNGTKLSVGALNSLSRNTFNIKTLLPNNYRDLSLDNFSLSNSITYLASGASGNGNISENLLLSYNKDTGILTSGVYYWIVNGQKSYTVASIVVHY